jgi:hypothetical protein
MLHLEKNKPSAFFILLFLVVPSNLNAQITKKTLKTEEVSVNKVWDDFIKNDSTLYRTIKIAKPNEKRGKEMAMYKLIQAYSAFYEGDCDKETIANVMNYLENIRTLFVNTEEIPHFSDQYEKLNNLISNCQGKIAEKYRQIILTKAVTPPLDDVNRRVITVAKDNIPKNGSCYDFKTFREWTDKYDLKFTFELRFCDSLKTDISQTYNVGKIGVRGVYETVVKEFLEDFLIPIYIKQGIDSAKCKEFIKVDIIGEADGIPIDKVLLFGDDLGVPAGIRYQSQYMGDEDIEPEVKYSKMLSYRIYSNEELSFARAYLAYLPFKECNLLDDNQPRIIARYHGKKSIGPEFRKVSIIIYAKNLFKGLSQKIKEDRN